MRQLTENENTGCSIRIEICHTGLKRDYITKTIAPRHHNFPILCSYSFDIFQSGSKLVLSFLHNKEQHVSGSSGCCLPTYLRTNDVRPISRAVIRYQNYVAKLLAIRRAFRHSLACKPLIPRESVSNDVDLIDRHFGIQQAGDTDESGWLQDSGSYYRGCFFCRHRFASACC